MFFSRPSLVLHWCSGLFDIQIPGDFGIWNCDDWRLAARDNWLCRSDSDALQSFRFEPISHVSPQTSSSSQAVLLTQARRYLVCLTIGPAFLAAAIYLCLSRIVVVYGESASRLRPANYTLIFVGCDFLSLLLQAAGGGIAASANTDSLTNVGRDIMVAGVAWQVFSLALFSATCLDFAGRVRKTSRSQLNPAFTEFRESAKFKLFLFSLATATLTIFTRSVFRVAELSGGFHGRLATQEVTFMILEGAMIAVAVICLTVFHPGLVFGKEDWDVAAWKLRRTRMAVDGSKAAEVAMEIKS